MSKASKQKVLTDFYNKLFQTFGKQYWWPGETPFEVMVGAVLTQNTNWSNVEKAIANLKEQKVLSPHKLRALSHTRLAALIKPAGYFNVKAKRLKNFLSYMIKNYDGDVNLMRRKRTESLRKELLSVNGIGKETADSILLYALNKTVFVIDAYTKRFLLRHDVISESADYDEVQLLFMENMKHDRQRFNEYHALIVRLGKEYCRPKPRCENCPLNVFPPHKEEGKK